MLDVQQYIFEIREAEDIDSAFRILQKYLCLLGIDRVVYSLMTDFRSIGLEAGHAILGNYPSDWMQYYQENKYEDIDPVRKILMLTSEPFEWCNLERFKDIHKTEKLLMNEAEDAKLLSGMGLGIHGPLGETVGMGFASSSGGVDLGRHTKVIVRILAHEFHSVFINFYAHKQRRYTELLSKREIEVLKWLARGKTVPEITIIMSIDGSISESTIRFHIRNVYLKLEVGTVPQAVAKALASGILTYADLGDRYV